MFLSEDIDEDSTDIPTWSYGILQKDGKYYVCERFWGEDWDGAHTGPVRPSGESPEELIADLKDMLADVEKALAAPDIVFDEMKPEAHSEKERG